MKKLLPLLAALAVPTVSLAPAAAAQAQRQRGVDDPRAFVAAQYDAYRRGDVAAIPEPDYAYSTRLAGLFRDYAAAWTDGVGALDFDWWINGQDWELGQVALTVSDDGADRRVVIARFTNFDTPAVNHFRFIRENGRWYLDDVESEAEGENPGWTLSDILRERP